MGGGVGGMSNRLRNGTDEQIACTAQIDRLIDKATGIGASADAQKLAQSPAFMAPPLQ